MDEVLPFDSRAQTAQRRLDAQCVEVVIADVASDFGVRSLHQALILQIQFFEHVTPGRRPVYRISMSYPGRSPDRRIRFFARSAILTGSPMSSTNILHPLPIAKACNAQSRRYGNGHKVAAHFRMSDCQRATHPNLFFKDRDDTPITPKDITKAHRHELGSIFCLKGPYR